LPIWHQVNLIILIIKTDYKFLRFYLDAVFKFMFTLAPLSKEVFVINFVAGLMIKNQNKIIAD